jgi:hypothetical protein
VPLIVRPDLGFCSSDASRPASYVTHGALAPSQSAFEDAITHDVEELCSLFDRGLSGEADDDEAEEDDPMDGGAEDGEASMRNLGV